MSLRLFKASGALKAEEYETRSLTVPLRRVAKLTVADKKVTSSSTGALRTTITASADVR
ncbi:hypothetical protein [Streptomyces sp. T028]|uniref:hypothetical protein n=1 Tax=Streptomyces sp. T028 TaxID=3394379 RepID=UPI003A894179